MEEQSSVVSRRAVLAGTSLAAVSALLRPAMARAVGDGPAYLVLADAKVDLMVSSFSNPLARGTVNGELVHATGSLYGGSHGGPGTVTGSLAGQHVAAVLAIKDQAPSGSGYVTTARLTASVGDIALTLLGSFDLDAKYAFLGGPITGSDRGLRVDISAKPYSWSGTVGYGAKVVGRYGGLPISITAEVPPGPGESGSVKGTVGRGLVDLRVHEAQQSGTRLTGTFSGPVELLALIIGAVAFFAS